MANHSLRVSKMMCWVLLGTLTIDWTRAADDSNPLEAVIQNLSQQVSTLTARVAVLETIQTNLQKTIAFHAWGTRNPVHTAAGAIIVLDYAATNMGNAYDSLTGVFTAPVSGLYDFQTSILAYIPSSTVEEHASLCVDTVVVGKTISDIRHTSYSQSTVRAIVHVNAGQKVYLKNPDTFDENYYDSTVEPFTTFTGVLIKAD